MLRVVALVGPLVAALQRTQLGKVEVPLVDLTVDRILPHVVEVLGEQVVVECAEQIAFDLVGWRCRR